MKICLIQSLLVISVETSKITATEKTSQWDHFQAVWFLIFRYYTSDVVNPEPALQGQTIKK